MFFLIKLVAYFALVYIVAITGLLAWTYFCVLPSPANWIVGLPLAFFALFGAKLFMQARL